MVKVWAKFTFQKTHFESDRFNECPCPCKSLSFRPPTWRILNADNWFHGKGSYFLPLWKICIFAIICSSVMWLLMSFPLFLQYQTSWTKNFIHPLRKSQNIMFWTKFCLFLLQQWDFWVIKSYFMNGCQILRWWTYSQFHFTKNCRENCILKRQNH